MNFSVKISALLFLCASGTAFSMAPGKTLLTRTTTKNMPTSGSKLMNSGSQKNTKADIATTLLRENKELRRNILMKELSQRIDQQNKKPTAGYTSAYITVVTALTGCCIFIKTGSTDALHIGFLASIASLISVFIDIAAQNKRSKNLRTQATMYQKALATLNYDALKQATENPDEYFKNL